MDSVFLNYSVKTVQIRERKNYYVLEKDGKTYFAKELVSKDPEDIENFKNEIKANLLFSKIPFIPKIVEYGSGNHLFLLFEYFDQNTLEKKTYDVEQTVKIIYKVCKILEIFHKSGYIFGDLKASNIFLKEDEVYLLDLGNVTKIGEKLIYATKSYCSPYQFNNRTAKVQFDFYALGILFYELLIGYNPLEKILLENNLNFNHVELPNVSTIILNISKDIEQVILKLTNKKIEENYSNIFELEQDLEKILKK